VLPLLSQGGLFYVYFGEIDSKSHHYGMDSKEVEKSMDKCFTALEDFWKELAQVKLKVACMVTADHGMTSIDPATTFFLNRELPRLEAMIEKGSDNRLLTPAGSCRDYFLHVLPEKLQEVKALLTKALEDRAIVREVSELIQEGFFGSKDVSASFLGRVGNLVILPHGNHSIWWYEKDRFDQKFFAMHGGLTRAEMETIFLFSTVNK
jgi:predicted AlkP superfamily pyrophosphatase or phosphodiesterase